MTDNKERAAFEAWAIKRLNKYGLPYFLFAKRDGEYMDGGAQHAWDGWQARAALAAPQEKAEPVEMEPTLPVNVYGKLFSVPIPVHVHLVGLRMQIEELEAAPVAAQASEPVGRFMKKSKFGPWVEVEGTPDGSVPLYTAPPSAEAVRNAALDHRGGASDE